MDLGLKDKVALVLASSKGLGKQVAKELAAEGAHVAICGTNQGTLWETKAEIEQATNSEILAVPCDLTKKEDRENLVSVVKGRLGKVDILVTNMGGPPPGPFESYGLEDWEELFNFLFLSAVDIIKQTIADMKANGFGRILLITSIASKQPVDNLISSNSMRAGLVGFMKSLSNEYAPHGITVNNILPGFTRTERLDELFANSPNLKESKRYIPMKRFGTPEEFSAVVTFLASERASYVTGVSIPVDGGWIKGI
ncbi:MAG: SDR family oxidoreductase [Flavobacteriaceae bacterium]